MQNSKQYLQTHKILPRISFKDGQAHLVKLLNDKEDKIKDDTGKEIEGMKYLVVESGENKTFFTSSTSLISQLAECEVNEEVSVQMKSVKGEDGTWRSQYKVIRKGQAVKPMGEVAEEEIPVIESEEQPDIPGEEEPPASF